MINSSEEKNGNRFISNKALVAATGLVAVLGYQAVVERLGSVDLLQRAAAQVTSRIEVAKIDRKMRAYELAHGIKKEARSEPLMVSGTLQIDTPGGQCYVMAENDKDFAPCRPGAPAVMTVVAATPKVN